MKINRSSGILMHITSLPSKFGIGDLGPAACDFLEFLSESGHSYWQLLPLNPTDSVYSHSPYSTHSAFAGNPLLISPELLEEQGLVDLKDFEIPKKAKPEKVIFEAVEKYKSAVLSAAFRTWKTSKSGKSDYKKFEREHSEWLDNYCLYLGLRKKFDNLNWIDWPEDLRDRKPAALKDAEKELIEEIEKEKFIQYLFFQQWAQLTERAHQKGVKFFGDIPFYVNHDSADCWANPELFKLDAEKEPTHISGVPPDMFSETGQLWGTPVYNWRVLKQDNYSWWFSRLRQNLLLFDLVRLDHFRAFSAFWEVPAGEDTAQKGKWINTPGMDFFSKLKKDYPKMPFVAEDLGILDEGVYELLEEFDFPRMKVLHFAFGNASEDNPYLPFHHLPNDVVYPGTHDNNTTKGWYNSADKRVKAHLEEYVAQKVSKENVHRVMHRLALQSVADLAVVPMQDILGLGEEGIMNIPGSTKGNWAWRMKPGEKPSAGKISEIKKINRLYGRGVKRPSKEKVQK